MTDAPALGTGNKLTFNAPLSTERADRLAAELAAHGPSSVLDLGSGWGELLLRVLSAAPYAKGSGSTCTGVTSSAAVRRRASAGWMTG